MQPCSQKEQGFFVQFLPQINGNATPIFLILSNEFD